MLLQMLTEDTEAPPQPRAVDALSQALALMSESDTAPPYIDRLGGWLAHRLEAQAALTGATDSVDSPLSGGASSHVTLKCLKVMISLMDGGVGATNDDEGGARQLPLVTCLAEY